MTTTPKRSLQRGVLSLLESAAWSVTPWRSLREITQSVTERGEGGPTLSARSSAHGLLRQSLEKLARRGLVEVKSESGARLYRAVLSPIWSLASKEPRVCGGTMAR